MRHRSTVSLVLWLLTFAAFGGCSSQGEGEVCDPSADDCQSGLTCQVFSGVNGHRCCPPDLATSKAAACAGQLPLLDAGTTPSDASPADETATDAPSESAPEAGAADSATE